MPFYTHQYHVTFWWFFFSKKCHAFWIHSFFYCIDLCMYFVYFRNVWVLGWILPGSYQTTSAKSGSKSTGIRRGETWMKVETLAALTQLAMILTLRLWLIYQPWLNGLALVDDESNQRRTGQHPAAWGRHHNTSRDVPEDHVSMVADTKVVWWHGVVAWDYIVAATVQDLQLLANQSVLWTALAQLILDTQVTHGSFRMLLKPSWMITMRSTHWSRMSIMAL